MGLRSPSTWFACSASRSLAQLQVQNLTRNFTWHLDGWKHKQLMESAAFELEQQNVFYKSSRKGNKTEAVKKDDQQDLKAASGKNQFENNDTNFFFSCQKCFRKFLSTRLLRNHTCGDQPSNISNKLFICHRIVS